MGTCLYVHQLPQLDIQRLSVSFDTMFKCITRSIRLIPDLSNYNPIFIETITHLQSESLALLQALRL